MPLRRSVLLPLLLLSFGAASELLDAAPLPSEESETTDAILALAAPIDRWDEAIPLENGLIGGLLWGEGNEIRLSLDRGDLWDERLPELYLRENWNYGTIRKLKAAGRQDEISRLFDHPYNQVPYPTKLPGGRLVITLDRTRKAHSFSLDIDRAVGAVDLGSTGLGSGGLEVFFSALEPVALIRHRGPVPTVKILRPEGG